MDGKAELLLTMEADSASRGETAARTLVQPHGLVGGTNSRALLPSLCYQGPLLGEAWTGAAGSSPISSAPVLLPSAPPARRGQDCSGYEWLQLLLLWEDNTGSSPLPALCLCPAGTGLGPRQGSTGVCDMNKGQAVIPEAAGGPGWRGQGSQLEG